MGLTRLVLYILRETNMGMPFDKISWNHTDISVKINENEIIMFHADKSTYYLKKTTEKKKQK